MNLLKKQPTVEEIHAEFDSAEERILKECDDILTNLQIPTETQLERKASMLESLGFVNSETVHKAKPLKEQAAKIKQQIAITSQQASYIREMKVKYPKEKFLTVDELERICEKYNLIHAPVKNYVKDIPEKNVFEMANAKKLEISDAVEVEVKITNFSFWDNATKEYKNWIQENILSKTFSQNELNNDSEIQFGKLCKEFKGDRGSEYWFHRFKLEKIDKSGLFIAAPESHFNLEGLTKKSKFGFFDVEIKEIKDPVVFEYCKNNLVRIITKWGTDDDQSYLDPSLFNEQMN